MSTPFRQSYTWEEACAHVRKKDEKGYEWRCSPYRTSRELATAMEEGRSDLAEKAADNFQEALDVVLPETEGGVGDQAPSVVGAFPNVRSDTSASAAPGLGRIRPESSRLR